MSKEKKLQKQADKIAAKQAKLDAKKAAKEAKRRPAPVEPVTPDPAGGWQDDQSYSASAAKVKKPVYKRPWFIVLIVIIAICIVAGAMGGGGSSSTKAPTARDNAISDMVTDDNKLSKEAAGNIYDAMKAIGIKYSKASDFSYSKKVFVFNYKNAGFTGILNKDKTVYSIISGSYTFFSKGKASKNANDYVITEDMQASLVGAAQYDVKANLKAPSTAKFPASFSEYSFSRSKTIYKITGYVDAENSYGAMIRSNFYCKYDWNGKTDSTPQLLDISIK